MKLLFGFALGCAILWTAFLWFVNSMKPTGIGPFIGGNTLIVVWLVVGVLGILLAAG